ncbi:MAG: GDSL-type esterase/lipase family protein [Oscillospiraceae bacterium]
MSKRLSSNRKQQHQLTVWIMLLLLLLAVIAVSVVVLSHLPAESQSRSSVSLSSSKSSVSSGSGVSIAPSEPILESSSSITELSSTVEQGAVFGRVSKSDAAADSYFEDAVFIGDSLTAGLGNYGVLPAGNVLADVGINLDTIQTKTCIATTDGAVTILDALKAKNPSKIYIMLGSNGIAWVSPADLAQKFEAFLDLVLQQHPDAVVYIESVLPVTAAKQAKDARYSNAAIQEYNQRLLQLAEQKQVYFLDTHAAFAVEDGTLNVEYAEADGMHLKKTGYYAMVEYFKTHTAG